MGVCTLRSGDAPLLMFALAKSPNQQRVQWRSVSLIDVNLSSVSSVLGPPSYRIYKLECIQTVAALSAQLSAL